MTVTGQLHILAAMETARTEVADRAMEYWSVREFAGGDYNRILHARLLAACETYAAARELLFA